MTKHPDRLWIIALALGWFFDFLFWGKSIGVNFAISVALVLLSGFYLLIGNGQKPASKSLLLIIPLSFFAIMTFSRREPLTLILSYTITFITMGILAVTYQGGRWMRYSLFDYFYKFFQLITSIVSSPISFIIQIRKERLERGPTSTKLPVTPVLRGLLIAIPVVACFASLLASADLVFNQKIIDFLKIFEFGKISEYIVRLIIILLWAYALAGTFLHASSKSQDEKLLGEEKPVIRPFIGFTETVIVLGCVIILFLLFVVVQFRYFFGGNLNIGVNGFTYSQYARRGFNELVTVAFFSLIMVLGLSTITKRENNLQRRIYSGLSIAIVALVMVILVSAYQRLSLSIDWHGYSRLRIYPQVFLIWVGVLFVAVVILEVIRYERFFAFAAVLASIGFAVSLCLVNVDDSIVRHNIARAVQGKHFNPSYLATLSSDAVPTLADEFQNSSVPNSVKEGIGAALLCHLHHDFIAAERSNGDWRSFDLSLWNAKNALDGIKNQLAGYHINVDKTPMRVKTPSAFFYNCVDTEPSDTE